MEDNKVLDPTESESVDISLCKTLFELEVKRLSLEAEVKGVKKQIASIAEKLYPQILPQKTQPLGDGMRLQTKRSLQVNKVSGVSVEQVVGALKDDEDWKWLIREEYQSSKLKEKLKEIEDDLINEGDVPDQINDILPDILKPFFNVFEDKKVVVYGAKNKALASVEAAKKDNKDF